MPSAPGIRSPGLVAPATAELPLTSHPVAKTPTTPPETASYKGEDFGQRASRRHRRALIRCCIIALLFLACSAAVLIDRIFRPRGLIYSVNRLSVSGFDLDSPSISPEFIVGISAGDPSHHVGIHYKYCRVSISRGDVDLGNGVVEPFRQPKRNVTVLEATLEGENLVLPSALKETLAGEQWKERVPLNVTMEAKVSFHVGSVNSWTASVDVTCHVEVDGLLVGSRIISSDCRSDVNFW